MFRDNSFDILEMKFHTNTIKIIEIHRKKKKYKIK